MPKVSNKINWNTDSISFYKFICKDPEIKFVYVGHTTNFASRKSHHKGSCNNPNILQYNTPVYQFIRANGGWENWTMIECHSQICKSPRDAERVEQELINQQHQVLNTNKAHSGIELPSNHHDYQTQYYIQNKEKITEQHTQYRATHKEQTAKENAQYRATHKEEIAQYQAQYQATHKKEKAKYDAEYQATHKEQVAKKQAKYYKNKKIEKLQHNLFKTQVLLEIVITTDLIE